MTLKCPECGLKNKVIPIPGGFYYNQVEYRCTCGYYLATFALNFSDAEKDLKRIIRKDVMPSLGKIK